MVDSDRFSATFWVIHFDRFRTGSTRRISSSVTVIMSVEEAGLPAEGGGDPEGVAALCREAFRRRRDPKPSRGHTSGGLNADVLAYKQREKETRVDVLDEVAAEGQRLKLGD